MGLVHRGRGHRHWWSWGRHRPRPPDRSTAGVGPAPQHSRRVRALVGVQPGEEPGQLHQHGDAAPVGIRAVRQPLRVGNTGLAVTPTATTAAVVHSALTSATAHSEHSMVAAPWPGPQADGTRLAQDWAPGNGGPAGSLGSLRQPVPSRWLSCPAPARAPGCAHPPNRGGGVGQGAPSQTTSLCAVKPPTPHLGPMTGDSTARPKGQRLVLGEGKPFWTPPWPGPPKVTVYR